MNASWNYEYYADGKLKKITDSNNAIFDRAFDYDHIGRLQEARTGSEARGGNTADGPFKQTYSYDVWENTTGLSSRVWTETPQTQNVSFTNNRRQYWSYDNEGHLTSDLQALFTYDAAGRPREFKANTYVGGWPTSYPTQSVQEVSQTFDGNSAPVKKTTINRWEELVGEEIQVQQSTTSTYFLRSTVLGGKVVAELSETGTKQLGYVFADEMRIATQYIYLSGSDVGWTSTSPATGSEYMTDMFLARKELDPLGTDVTYAPQPDLISEPIFYNPKFDRMPLEIEGGPSAEYQQANQAWASLMAEAFQAFQDRARAEQLWQSGKRSEAMAILMKNPNVGIEYRAVYKNEVIKHGSYFGQDAADFLYGIDVAVDKGLLSSVDGNGAGIPQDPVTDNRPKIDNSGAADQSCRIEVSFDGSYDGNLNGPSIANSERGLLYGIGFSVKISDLSGNVALRSTPNDPKPKNTWLVEQWVADFNFRNGQVVRQDTVGRMDNLARLVPRPRRDGNTVSWYDHPGTEAVGTQGYFTKRNFYIKAYNGKRHCEVEFHLTFRVFNRGMVTPGWGPGPYN